MPVDPDLDGTPGQGSAPRLASSTMAISFDGCYQDNSDRAFTEKWRGITMQECAALALVAGESRFGLQWPQGYNKEKVQCFFGDKGVLGQGEFVQRPDSECISESWSPTAFGEQFEYHGAGWRNAVYSMVTAADQASAVVEVNGDTYNADQVEIILNDLATCQGISDATGGCMMVPMDPGLDGLPACDVLSSAAPGLSTYYEAMGEKCWLGATKVESMIDTVAINGQQYSSSDLLVAAEVEGRLDRVAVPEGAHGLQELDWLNCQPVDSKCSLVADEVTQWVLDAVAAEAATCCDDVPDPRVRLLEWRDSLLGDIEGSSMRSWSMDTKVCEWEGFTCTEEGMIRTVRIVEQDLVGSLPPLGEVFGPQDDDCVHEDGIMRESASIYMYRNSFGGPIPDDWKRLPARIVRIDGNGLTGTLPASWTKMPDIDTLNFQDNRLTGTLPAAWSRFSDYLDVLKLADNELTGTLPPEWKYLTLETITLKNNNLRGDLPPEWGEEGIGNEVNEVLKTNLYEVYLYPGNDDLSRSIPDSWCFENTWPSYCPDIVTLDEITLD